MQQCPAPSPQRANLLCAVFAKNCGQRFIGETLDWMLKGSDSQLASTDMPLVQAIGRCRCCMEILFQLAGRTSHPEASGVHQISSGSHTVRNIHALIMSACSFQSVVHLWLCAELGECKPWIGYQFAWNNVQHSACNNAQQHTRGQSFVQCMCTTFIPLFSICTKTGNSNKLWLVKNPMFCGSLIIWIDLNHWGSINWPKWIIASFNQCECKCARKWCTVSFQARQASGVAEKRNEQKLKMRINFIEDFYCAKNDKSWNGHLHEISFCDVVMKTGPNQIQLKSPTVKQKIVMQSFLVAIAWQS